jgi:hypothetical protein
MWKELLGAALAPLADAWKARIQAKHEEAMKQKEIDDAVHARTVDQIKTAESYEQAWNLAQINNSSWKDEWFTIILSVPLVLAFIPKAVSYLTAGFQALGGMPLWYRGFLATAVAAAFGFQKVTQMWKWWNQP